MKKLARIAVVAVLCVVLFAGLVGAESPLYQGLPTVRLVVDGQELQTDVPAVILGGRTMVPLKAIAQALGAAAKWDPETYTVTIAPVSDPHVPSDYVDIAERLDAELMWQPLVGESDPDYKEKNQQLAVATQNIMVALESCVPPSDWRSAHDHAVIGLQYLRAAQEVANQAYEALEKAEHTKKMSDVNEAKGLGIIWKWLGEQIIAQHDALHAEFVRLTGREPDHQIIWEDEEQ